MDYTKTENLSGILWSLDFKKAFDKVLDTLNFGESVERWINVFYANIEKATKWLSPREE